MLRPIKRYGRIGRRAPPNASPATPRADPNASPAAPAVVGGESPPQWTQWTPPSPMDRKDYKHLFVSIDEASTHVHPFHPHIQLHGAHNPTLAGAAAAQPSAKKFRLLVAAHDPSDNTFLGTAVSGPIRVVANNDVPKGAAVISLDVSMPTSWKGFNMTDNAAAAAMQPMRQWDDAAVQTPRVASARRGPPPPPPLPRSMRTTKVDGSEPSASAWKRARAADEEEDAAGALAALAGVATLKADTNVRETPVVARKTARRAAALSKPASAAAVPPTPNPPIPPADHAPLAAAAAATAASGHIPPFMTMPTDAMSAMHNPAMAQLFASMFAGGGMPMPAVPPSGETSAFYFFLNMFLSRMGKAPPAPGGGQMAIPAALMPGMAPPLP